MSKKSSENQFVFTIIISFLAFALIMQYVNSIVDSVYGNLAVGVVLSGVLAAVVYNAAKKSL